MSEKDWNSRLRYVRREDGVEQTALPVICGKWVCSGFIRDNNKWYIFNRTKGRYELNGVSSSNEQAKRDLKKALISLGAYFVDEVRSSTKNPIRRLTDKAIDGIIKTKGKNDEDND